LKKENPKLKNELNLGFFYRLFYNALNSECALQKVQDKQILEQHKVEVPLEITIQHLILLVEEDKILVG
jgi:hypothetical protein